MSVATFLANLFESGNVTVTPAASQDPDSALDEVLASAEAVHRLNLAGDPPAFSLEVARWAARTFYGAVQFLVCRDLPADTMTRFFAQSQPASDSPAHHYSADLVLQYLPDLIATARGLATADPLVDHLLALGRAWPLSSVGIRDCAPAQLAGFIEDPALRQLYIDRILSRHDLSRLSHPLVAQAARETLGAFPELCPEAARVLGMEQEPQLPTVST